MEVIHQENSLTIYDDFAHHPTEIKTTLAGLRARVGTDNILAVIEPASHTMKKGTHKNTLQASAVDANDVVWFSPDNVKWDMSDLTSSSSRVIDDIDRLVDETTRQILNKDGPLHVVIMSNGSFQGAHRRIVDSLRR